MATQDNIGRGNALGESNLVHRALRQLSKQERHEFKRFMHNVDAKDFVYLNFSKLSAKIIKTHQFSDL